MLFRRPNTLDPTVIVKFKSPGKTSYSGVPADNPVIQIRKYIESLLDKTCYNHDGDESPTSSPGARSYGSSSPSPRNSSTTFFGNIRSTSQPPTVMDGLRISKISTHISNSFPTIRYFGTRRCATKPSSEDSRSKSFRPPHPVWTVPRSSLGHNIEAFRFGRLLIVNLRQLLGSAIAPLNGDIGRLADAAGWHLDD